MRIKRIDLNPEFDFAFSSCVVAGDTIYTAHHAGYDRETGRWPQGIATQTETCFRNLSRTLQAADATLNDRVKTTVYLKDLGDFQAMNCVYRRQFPDRCPARMTATSEFLDAECLMMIEAIAYRASD